MSVTIDASSWTGRHERTVTAPAPEPSFAELTDDDLDDLWWKLLHEHDYDNLLLITQEMGRRIEERGRRLGA